jgi:SPP1 gp7 family putative phage head morphogenesis protein
METGFDPVPHEEAAAIIEGKPVVAREVFDRMLPELRARVFTITGVESMAVMQRVRDEIASLPRGSRWDDVKESVADSLEPFLGDDSEKRAELLLRTHGFQSFEASNHRVGMEDEDTTHWQYLATEDDRVRPTHLALNGIILPKTDPFWDDHTPPWEWGCRCRKRPMNVDMVAEAKAADKKRNPDDRLVFEGPMARKLNEGHLIRDGQAYDVSPPTGADAYHFHPDDLRISLEDLRKRYEPEVFAEFEAWAKEEVIFREGGEGREVTVWDWLQGEEL